MSDLKCQECGHDADAHSADPDGVGDCIIGWTKRSPRDKCDCTNTAEEAELSALRAENAQLKSQLSAPTLRECPTNHGYKIGTYVKDSLGTGTVWTDDFHKRHQTPFCPDCGVSLNEGVAE